MKQDLPTAAAERLRALLYHKKHLADAGKTVNIGEEERRMFKHQECSCSTCHDGRYRSDCMSICPRCLADRTLYIEEVTLMLQVEHENCCLSVAPNRLHWHFQADEHLLERYAVLLTDIDRLQQVARVLPDLLSHPDVWVPLMKIAYSTAMTLEREVSEVRMESIGRQLLKDKGSVLLPKTKLYPSRLVRQDKRMNQIQPTYNFISPTGAVVGKDYLMTYMLPGQSIEYRFWGEGDEDDA